MAKDFLDRILSRKFLVTIGVILGIFFTGKEAEVATLMERVADLVAAGAVVIGYEFANVADKKKK